MMDSLRRLDTEYASSERSTSRPELTPRAKSRPLLFERHLSEQGRSRANGPLSPGSPNTPRSPHTPFLGRSLSSNFNSPGLTFRVDDDNFVFEFGSRFLRAGIGGEKAPRCQLACGPNQKRRGEDYRQWLQNTAVSSLCDDQDREAWGRPFEFWNMDLRRCSLGVIGDRLDRMVRIAIREHILIVDDSRKRRFIIAIPPVFPHPLLNLLLNRLFSMYPAPLSITLLSTPLLCAVAAGLRSALVVDIGWNETVVSALYEYREVQHKTSSRGMKNLTWEMRNMLKSALAYSMTGEEDENAEVSFEEVEEIIAKLGWCQISNEETSPSGDTLVTLTLSSPEPSITISIPRSSFSIPIEQSFLETQSSQYYDDHDLPLPQLIYESLLTLSIDIRNEVLPRIIITGGGANIKGLKARLIQEVKTIIESRGWDPVRNYGKAPLPRQRNHKARESKQSHTSEVEEHPVNRDFDDESNTPAYLQPPLPDPILAAIRARAAQPSVSGPTGESNRNSLTESLADGLSSTLIRSHAPNIRSVKSLGPWAGASLIAGLKIRGLVEVERERFLSHGLSGADRDEGSKRHNVELSNQQAQRQSFVGPSSTTLNNNKSGDRESGSWTLGIWA